MKIALIKFNRNLLLKNNMKTALLLDNKNYQTIYNCVTHSLLYLKPRQSQQTVKEYYTVTYSFLLLLLRVIYIPQ